MKALSIQQPWAWAILYLGKRVENRTWRSSLRGPVLIHAGLRVDHDSIEDLAPEIEKIPEPRPKAYRGAIVGCAIIVDCVRPEGAPDGQDSWAMGPWCFVLDDVRPFAAPIPFKGSLGFFEVPDLLVAPALEAVA